MFENFYAFHKQNTVNAVLEKYPYRTLNYAFKTENTRYLIQVEEYPDDIYIIKFCRKQDRRSSTRFNIMTNEFKCTRIVSTCIRVLVSILEFVPNASFGFLGAQTIDGIYKESKSNTKRFRIYKQAMENVIGENHFYHSMDQINSTYLMVNMRNKNVGAFVERSRNLFEEIFPDLEN